MVGEALVNNDHVAFNHTCGLHVDVGHGDNYFELLTRQKLFSLLYLGGEDILNLLLREHRQNNNFCYDLRSHSNAKPADSSWTPTGNLLSEWYHHCFPVDLPNASEPDNCHM